MTFNLACLMKYGSLYLQKKTCSDVRANVLFGTISSPEDAFQVPLGTSVVSAKSPVMLQTEPQIQIQVK
jgi:hypothetical protein